MSDILDEFRKAMEEGDQMKDSAIPCYIPTEKWNATINAMLEYPDVLVSLIIHSVKDLGGVTAVCNGLSMAKPDLSEPKAAVFVKTICELPTTLRIGAILVPLLQLAERMPEQHHLFMGPVMMLLEVMREQGLLNKDNDDAR